MSTPNDDAADAEAERTANGAADLLDDAAPVPPSPPLDSSSPPSSPPPSSGSAAAAVVNEVASMTPNTSPHAERRKSNNDDDVSTIASGSGSTSKPSIATVTAIVNEVLRQKEAGGAVDIASIASKEVEKFYDAEESLPPGGRSRSSLRSHPWDEKDGDAEGIGDETKALFSRMGSKGAAAIISSKIKAAIGSSKKKQGGMERGYGPTSPPGNMFGRKSPPANMVGDFIDEESPDFNDLCEELGINAQTHPHLRRAYRMNSSGIFSNWCWDYSTVQQVLRSSKCHYYCIIATCLVGVSIGFTTAVSRGYQHVAKRSEELHPHWIKEEEAKEDKDWWKEETSTAPTPHKPDPMEVYMEEHKSTLSKQELQDLYYTLSDAYLPIWFDRSMGWDGTTFEEAIDFCRSHDDFVPCPYDVYCPGQAKKLIFDEVFEEEGKERSWAPILDDYNEWVQVSNGQIQCITYSGIWKKRPDWGLTPPPSGSEEAIKKLTKHIMCCLEHPLGDEFDSMKIPVPLQMPPDVAAEHGSGVDDPIPPPPPPPTDVATNKNDKTGPSFVPEHEITFTALDEEIRDNYRPFWFDNNDGWDGTTYEAAKEFCESIPNGPDGETFHLCPVKAYCPNGLVAHKPLAYQMDAFGEGLQWAPVSNNVNGWVMVGKMSDQNPHTCNTFLNMNRREPDWGLDGTQTELKKHILCCQVKTGHDGGIKKADIAKPIMDDEPASKTPIQGVPNDAEKPIVQITPTDVVANPPSSTNEEGSTPPAASTQEEDGHHTGAGNSSPHAGEHKYDDPISAMKKTLNPLWFSTEEEWRGGSHTDALQFCDARQKELCPYAAYCPEGPTFPVLEGADLQGGETSIQWSPVINGPNKWVLIGTLDDNGSTQCMDYENLNGAAPLWGLDGSMVDVKHHILCCTKTSAISKTPVQQQQQQQNADAEVQSQSQSSETSEEEVGMDTVQQQQQQQQQQEEENADVEVPSQSQTSETNDEEEGDMNEVPVIKSGTWFQVINGWNAGSHEDAIHFCALKEVNGKRMELCAYNDYCPSGPSRPPVDGLGDIGGDGEETEQWAPTSSGDNQWVMVGMHGTNHATQCLTHGQLHGEAPSWGLDESNKEKKQHIMCCFSVEDTLNG
ncbi:hypothetical protein ACHAXR_011331 [Thalassiosira sp. AJA248-18]